MPCVGCPSNSLTVPLSRIVFAVHLWCAAVGFFWLCILSSVQSSGAASSSNQLLEQEDEEDDDDDDDDEVCFLKDGFTCDDSWVESDKR